MPDGKPANQFAFDDKPKDKEFAESIVAGCHDFWKKLMAGESPAGDTSLANSTLGKKDITLGLFSYAFFIFHFFIFCLLFIQRPLITYKYIEILE